MITIGLGDISVVYRQLQKHPGIHFKSLFSLRLIGSAMFGATFNLAPVGYTVSDYRNFLNTEKW